MRPGPGSLAQSSDQTEQYLKALKLQTFLREHDKVSRQCAAEGVGHPDFLLRLSELELIDRHHHMMDRRIKAARFPVVKTLDTFRFKAQPSINRALVQQLTRGDYIDRRENVLLIGNSGTGKTHLACGLALAACNQGRRVLFFTATGLVTRLLEKREERQMERFCKQLENQHLIVLDELGYVPLDSNRGP